MKRLQMLLVAVALMTGGSALASAQPLEHGGARDRDRDRSYDRDDRRFGDRDDFRFRDHNEHRIVGRFDRGRFVGERRFFNGYYWSWNGDRWCR
jgi:hypothetical protein